MIIFVYFYNTSSSSSYYPCILEPTRPASKTVRQIKLNLALSVGSTITAFIPFIVLHILIQFFSANWCLLQYFTVVFENIFHVKQSL